MVSLWPWRVRFSRSDARKEGVKLPLTWTLFCRSKTHRPPRSRRRCRRWPPRSQTLRPRLDGTRSAARRTKVLWTLYLSFAYLVYAIVLVLVVGWAKMGPWEWAGVAGGPLV